MQNRFGLVAALLLCLSFGAWAQTENAIIKGFVYDRSSGEPMIFTNVVLMDTKFAAQTDVNGYFSFTQIPEGTYTLFTTVIGYDTSKISVTVKPGDLINKKIFLNRGQRVLKGVEISARKIEKTTQINAGTTTVTPREIKLMPSAGGEPDIAQYLQVVPGVIFTGDQGGQLYIRGGAPSQTGILLDGVTIYNPFHQIGLFSVFETDAIRNVDIQSAGFNAQYGNRTSAILDVRTKDGNKNRTAGKVSVSPLMARAMVEGPLSKPKYEGGAGFTYLLSAKHSYFDKTSSSIYGGLGEPFKSSLPYSFTDLYGKVTFNGDNGSKINVFGFNFDDKAKAIDPDSLTEKAAIRWRATGAGTTFVITPGNSSALINGRFAYSKYNLDYKEADFVAAPNSAYDGTRSSGIEGFEGGIDFTYYMPHYSQLKYGLEVSGLHTALDYLNENGNTVVLDRRNTSAALFLMYRKNFGDKFILEPGFRMQYYSSISALSPEPRLGMKYNVSRTVRLKAAGGLYSQNIISTKSDRDIVNFFTGFILSPDEGVQNVDGGELNKNLQKAYHALGGIEVDIKNVELNLEPWYKNFYQNIELSRIKVLQADGNFTAGDGVAKGIDLSARYNKNRLYLWGVVSYQEIVYTTLVLKNNVVRIDENGRQIREKEAQSYAPPFDRRFNINLLAAYTAGKKKDWELSARYNIGSPFPFTQTQGFYENLVMLDQNHQLDQNVNTQNGQIGILYNNQINGGRLSWYHRLDVSVRKRFALSQYSNIETTLGVTNVYDRDNIFYVSRISGTRVYQLPVFPSLNVTWNF
ncbi:TonB-dependent receptor [Polluticoccus soli]|uniref:TonB-dependent receptor n=1 Tax=Polluticoccus soli TaxID=3034150 RepID=UPI0023E10B46|nr:TonB-dependent receptor [Flavipsychrobacter sp. JY13-12]